MLALLISLLLLQSTPPKPVALTSQRVIADYVTARNPGGLKVSSMEIKGVVSLDHSPGPNGWDIHYWSLPPNKAMLQFEQASHGDILYGRVNGKVKAKARGAAFAINGITAEAIEKNLEAVTENDFSKYKAIELLGRKMIGKAETIAVRFIPTEGDPDIRYFDRSSHLLLRIERAQRMVQPDKQESVYVITADFGEYADFDGIKLPKKTTYWSAEADVNVHVTSVSMNRDLNLSIFE